MLNETISLYVIAKHADQREEWIQLLRARESRLLLMSLKGVPTAQGKQGKWKKKTIPCQGKHRKYRNFVQAQGVLFAQVVHSLILKVKDIVIFAAKISSFC